MHIPNAAMVVEVLGGIGQVLWPVDGEEHSPVTGGIEGLAGSLG